MTKEEKARTVEPPISLVLGEGMLLDPDLDSAFDEDPFFSGDGEGLGDDPSLLQEAEAWEQEGPEEPEALSEDAPLDELDLEAEEGAEPGSQDTALTPLLPDFSEEDLLEEVERADLLASGGHPTLTQRLESRDLELLEEPDAWEGDTPWELEPDPDSEDDESQERERTAVGQEPSHPPLEEASAAALLGRDVESLLQEAFDDPTAIGSLPLLVQVPAPAPPREEMTRQVSLGVMGLEPALELELSPMWASFIREVRREIQAQRDPLHKAALFHEAAELLRTLDPGWLELASSLEVQALELAPAHVPAITSLLVQGGHLEGQAWWEVLEQTLARLAHAKGPDASRLAREVRLALALGREAQGALDQARLLYEEAQPQHGDAFLELNQARLALSQRDMVGYARGLSRAGLFVGEGPEADAQRALLLEEGASALRRHGHLPQAVELLRQAISIDPTSLSGYRALQVLAWQTGDAALEAEGLRGQLALLVEQGRDLRRADPRRKLLKRKVAARFFRLGQVLRRLGRHEEANDALRDALSVRRNELLYLRALAQSSQVQGDLDSLDNSLTRQVGLIVDTSLQALLLVDQAHVRLQQGDLRGGRALLERSLELAPAGLPARISLGRFFLEQGLWRELLSLRDGGLEGEQPDPLLEQAPARASEAWRRGEVLELILREEEVALQEYLHALRWQPGMGPWLRAAERLLLRQQRWEELAQVYRHALDALEEEEAAARMHRRAARLAVWAGQDQRAAFHMERWLEGGQAPLYALEELAQLKRRAGDAQGAAAALEALLAQVEAQSAGLEDAGLRAVELRSLRWLAQLYEGVLGDYEAARVVREKLLRRCPGDPDNLDHLRRVLVRQGAWAELCAVLESQAQGSDPGLGRRDLWLESARIHKRHLRQPERALEILEALLEEHPGDPTVEDRHEALLRERGDSEALALALERRALRNTTQDPGQSLRCWMEAGLLWRDALRQPERALEALLQVLRLEPGHALALRQVAGLLWALGRHQELADHYTLWMEHTQGAARATLAMEAAELLELHLRDDAGALALREEAEALDPGHTDNLRSLARLCRALGRELRLVEVLEALARRNQDRAEALALLVRAARVAERLELEPAARWRAVLALDPRHSAAQRGLERALRRRGSYGELLKHYLACAKESSDSLRVHYLLRIASVYQEMERLEDALEILRKVLALEPGCQVARLMLAAVAQDLGEHRLLAQVQVELAESAPSQEQQLGHLRQAAMLLGGPCEDLEAAEALWWRVLELDPSDQAAFEALRHNYKQGELPGALPAERMLSLLERRLEAEPDEEERASVLREATQLCMPLDAERAAHYLELLLELRPQDPAGLEMGAALAEEGGQPALAVQRMEAWLALPEHRQHPGRVGTLLRAATLLHHAQKDSAAAMALLEEVLALEPRDHLARRLMAHVCLAQGLFAQACEHFKDLFEEEVTAELALQVARILDKELGRSQEALTWLMRAQDLDPLDATALEEFMELVGRMRRSEQGGPDVRLLRDRLDWLVDASRGALDANPWDLERLEQLARLHRLRGKELHYRAVQDVMRYFGRADEEAAPLPPLLRPVGALSREDVSRSILPPGARGIRRRIFSMLWDSLAAVEPDELKLWGVRRGHRLAHREDHPLAGAVMGLLEALRVTGVEIYLHPNEPWAITPLLIPEPVLILGQGLQGRLEDPFHLFRLARVLELLREGKLLAERPNAPLVMQWLEQHLAQLGEGSALLPLFSADSDPLRARDGAQRLHRLVPRRLRRDLKLALEGRPEPEVGPPQRWLPACQQAGARTGLVICGSFGAAADAVSGARFILERSPHRAAEMLATLRQSDSAPLLTDLLRFVISEDYLRLRARLQATEAP